MVQAFSVQTRQCDVTEEDDHCDTRDSICVGSVVHVESDVVWLSTARVPVGQSTAAATSGSMPTITQLKQLWSDAVYCKTASGWLTCS
jgi:hypothetical protein